MKKKLINSVSSSKAVSYSLLIVLIFIATIKQPINQKPPSMSYSYLALGDSYTIGEQVELTKNFPNQVAALLKQDGIDLSSPQIIAKTGWTTDELADAISRAKLAGGYDFVTLLIGVNNQYRGRKVEEYVPEFESLLKQAIQFARHGASHVIVLSIPDWGVTPFAGDRNREQIAADIDAYNAANKKIAEQYGVHYLDITGWTREAAANPSLLAADNLHPSAKEYARWAEKIAGLVKNLIKH